MESIIRDKIVEHMVQNNLFSDKQHGFVPLRNCITNLLFCIENWSSLIEEGSPIDVIYTDFAKAFDRVPHLRLLQKIKNLGIRGRTLSWIKAFLTNRVQQVKVEDEYSSWTTVKSGIPQGSVLGPILFVIFINDMPDIVESAIQLFADDAKIYTNVVSSDCNLKLQEDLDKLMEWSHKWQLPFNIEKCASLHIGRNNRLHVYKMDGYELKQVNEQRDLGVIIDFELKFHKQTAAAIKKANSILGVIKKSFLLRDSSLVLSLYKSLVRPHMEYANIIWGPHYVQDTQSLERIQRRATKMIPELKLLSYENRLRKLKLPSLAHRRRRGDMIFMFKLISGKLNIDPQNFFKISETTTRGHKYKVFKKHAKKLTRINSFSQRVVNDWNALPAEIVEAKSIISFKNELDKYWREEMYITPF